MVIKNVNSKEEERIQVLNTKGISLKPRTRLRSGMEAEMKLIHNPGGRNEDFGKLVIVNDSFSEENIYVSKERYYSKNENSIDLQGNSRYIPERFCTNKQVYYENGSVSKSIQEDEVLMDVKQNEIVPELNQIKKFLQTYKEQTKFLQNKMRN